MSDFRGINCNLVCDSEITYYAVTETDISILSSNSGDKKEIGIGLIAVGIPCLLNSISYFNATPRGWALFNINFVIGLLGIIIGGILMKLWWTDRGEACKTIDRIKAGKKHKVKFSVTDK